MLKIVKILLFRSLLIFFGLLPAGLVFAQASERTPYFPYQTGDILIYHITQSAERQDDSKLTFVGDSVSENGDRFFFIETEGYFLSIAGGFKVDTAGNVYARNWWSGSDYWKVFDASKEINEPWIAYQSFGGYELGNIIEILSDEAFNVSSEVKRVHIYLGFEDSLATSGYDRNITRWKSGIGITQKFNFEGGPTHTLKGAVIDNKVYGDTTVFRHPPPGEVQKDYFPYQVGDVLVYNVTDSAGNPLSDSRIEFISDSVDAQGNTWYSIENEGYEPVFKQIMVDTVNNIYAAGWWKNNEEAWKVFDAYFVSGTPWLLTEQDSIFSLGSAGVLGEAPWPWPVPDYWHLVEGPIVRVEYFEADDSTKKAWEVTEKDTVEWDPDVGVISRYSFHTKISYELKGAFINGELRGDTAAVITSSEREPTIPGGITLHQNYPNPFNPSTTISYQMERSGQVTINLYTITGQLVKELLNTYNTSGSYSFQLNGDNLSSGIYILRGRLGEQTESMTITLIK